MLGGLGMLTSSANKGGSKDCLYPQSNVTAAPVRDELDAVAAEQHQVHELLPGHR